MMGYAGFWDFVRTSQSPQKTRRRSTHPTEKQSPNLSLQVLCGLRIFEVISNSHRTRNERVGVCFSLGCLDRCEVFCGEWEVPM